MKVLKFGAVWCPGCIIMKPRWMEIEQENEWLNTEFYDIDEEPEKAKEWEVIKTVPQFVFLDKNGKEIDRMKGEPSKKEILKKINEHKDK